MQILKSYTKSFVALLTPSNRKLLETYKHAFETTTADRDRLKLAYEKMVSDRNALAAQLQQLNSSQSTETPEKFDSESHGTEQLVIDDIAEVNDFSIKPELAQENFATLVKWVTALFDHEDIKRLTEDKLWSRPLNSTISASERAMIYFAMREMKIKNALEIGTYFAGTTQLMALAVYQTGGRLFTIDPYGADRVPKLLKKWPAKLASYVSFRPQFSTEFLGPTNGVPNFDFIFVDGDHRYPNVIHDLLASDENLRNGGIMIIDNAELPDVMSACRTFVRENSDYESVAVHEWWQGSQTRSSKKHFSEDFELLDAKVCFVVLRKAKTTSLFERRLVYWINGITDLAAPTVKVWGFAKNNSKLKIDCHMRYFMRDSTDPDCGTIKHTEVIHLVPGKFCHKITSDLVLKDEALGQNLNAEVILCGTPGDGSITDVGIKWGEHELSPNRNSLA